jgi:hypothetical protein
LKAVNVPDNPFYLFIYIYMRLIIHPPPPRADVNKILQDNAHRFILSNTVLMPKLKWMEGIMRLFSTKMFEIESVVSN